MLLGLAPGVWADTGICQPPPDLRDRLHQVELFRSGSCRPGQECFGQRIEAAEALLEEYPDELHAHRTYQDLLRFNARHDADAWEAAKRRYEASAREHPDDPVAQYLHLRTDPPTREAKDWSRLVEIAPDFPWGHLGLFAALVRTEEGISRTHHLEEFMRLCPTRAREPLQFFRMVDDQELSARHLGRLREAIAASHLEDQALDYPMLWSAEFGAANPKEHAAIRERVRADLERLQAAEVESSDELLQALQKGYSMVGDPDALARVETELFAAAPCSLDAQQATMEEALGAAGLGGEVSETLAREIFRQSAAWLAECPESHFFASLRFSMASKLGELSDEEILEEIDRYLAVWEKNTERIKTYRSAFFQSAAVILDRGLGAERALELLDREAGYYAKRREGRSTADLPESVRESVERTPIRQDLGLEQKRAEALIALRRAEEARETLDRAEVLLLKLRELIGDGSEPTTTEAAALWRLRGELAETEAKWLDALTYYQRALQVSPEPEIEERISALWAELGGSEAARDAVMDLGGTAPTAAGDYGAWETRDEELADFELFDLEGNAWTKSDLEGKTVLLNLWATWCGPCRAELPYFQKVVEKLAEREDVAVLTLNVDYNVGLVEPYLRSEGFDFPVLLAEDYALGIEGSLSIPQNWVLDRGGTLRRTQTGFAPNAAEEWMESTVRQVEAVAAGEGR